MHRKALSLVALVTFASVMYAQDCSTHTYNFDNGTKTANDATQHIDGSHFGVMHAKGNCTYSDQSGTNNCYIVGSTTPIDNAGEGGDISGPYKHGVNFAENIGSAQSGGPAITFGDEVVAAATSCSSIFPTCSVSVTINGSVSYNGTGIGGSISVSPSPIWTGTLPFSQTCAAYQYSSQPVCNPVGSPTQVPQQGYTWEWSYTSCQWVQVPLGPSPIIIDTNGEGFDLTSVEKGVMFDFYGDGHPIQIAWPAKGSKNGWLALPDANGQIKSARDLFGNITPQFLESTHPPNGFSALAVYDGGGEGGNKNGKIDPGDEIWAKLRVWIDDNHDGVAQTSELHTLDSLGIGSIALQYVADARVDKNGNQFRYKGRMNPASNTDDFDRKIFDVFLATN